MVPGNAAPDKSPSYMKTLKRLRLKCNASISLEVGQIHCYRHSFLYESYETLPTAPVFDVIHDTADFGWLNLPHIDYRILVDDLYNSRGAIGSDMKL